VTLVIVVLLVDVDVVAVDDFVAGVSARLEHAARMKSDSMRSRRVIAATVSALAMLAACDRDAPRFDVATVDTAVVTPSSSTTQPTVTTRPRVVTPTARPRLRTVPQLAHVTGNQAIVVTASKYGATTAGFTAYRRTAKGWSIAFGEWTAYVGAKGIAPPGEKREGDGRTPSGTYGFDFFFGVEPDPGVKFPFRRVTGPNIVWVENPDSPRYNQWVDSNEEPSEADEDNMYKPVVYAFGAVIAYNTKDRTPGLGSGIFLHVSHNGPTAGCVSLPRDKLLKVLRWLDPAASPVIVIAVS
jgi:L,D-peptidoglycan transpeptidase YkuD (ErfK/YbiS/YcfS/YnhG family)